MLCQVVVNNQHIASGLHEILRHTGRRIGCYVAQPGRIITPADNDHGVIERSPVAQGRDHLGNRRSALTYRAVNAHNVLPFLIEDSVYRDRGLASLAITQDQFSLAAPDGNEGIDCLEAGL